MSDDLAEKVRMLSVGLQSLSDAVATLASQNVAQNAQIATLRAEVERLRSRPIR